MVSVSAEDRERLEEMCKRHGVGLLVAFGSRVTGHVHAGSDLDLAVYQTDPGADRLDLWGDLQRVFRTHEADVVWLHRADPLLLYHVFRNAQLLFGERDTFLRYKVYAWRRFVEYERFFALEAEAVRKGIDRVRRAG